MNLGLPNMKLECQPFDCGKRWEDDHIIWIKKECKGFSFGLYKGTTTQFAFKSYGEPCTPLLNTADKPAKCRIPYLLNTRPERYQNQISQNALGRETRHRHTASSRRFILSYVLQNLNQVKVKVKVLECHEGRVECVCVCVCVCIYLYILRVCAACPTPRLNPSLPKSPK